MTVKHFLKTLFLSIVISVFFLTSLSACSGAFAGRIDDSTYSSGEKNSSTIEQSSSIDEPSVDYKSEFINLIDIINSVDGTIEGEGSVDSHKGIIDYQQKIYSCRKKIGNSYYSVDNSSSALVSVKHCVYVNGNFAVYGESADSALKKCSLSDYTAEFGVSPSDKGISGYIIDQSTVNEVELFRDSDNRCVYKANIATESAENARIQMKKFGDLKDYPDFYWITIAVTVDSSDNPIRVNICAEYSIKIAILGDMNCNMNINLIFSKGDTKGGIPQKLLDCK